MGKIKSLIKMNILVCDDEKTNAGYAEKLIQTILGTEHHIFTFTDPDKMKFFIEDSLKGNMDIALLDIDLKVDSGIEVAKYIKSHFPHVIIIFMTGYIEYSKNIFETDPVDFLVKPIKTADMRRAQERAQRAIEMQKQNALVIVNKGEIARLPVSHIVFLESSGRKMCIHSKDRVWETYMKFSDIGERMPSQFLRCHQSYMVNMDYIQSMSGQIFNLGRYGQVPISQSRMKMVSERFMTYLGDLL